MDDPIPPQQFHYFGLAEQEVKNCQKDEHLMTSQEIMLTKTLAILLKTSLE